MSQSKDLPLICQQSLKDLMRPELFKALCDPVRISIIANLVTRAEPSTVSELASCCGIDFSGVSRHLKLLREAGVVSATKDGREMHYALNSDDLAETLRGMADALDRCTSMAS